LNTKDLIEKLKSLGFKEYEAKVFIVLLKGSSMSASDIAKESNVIRNSIYDILKSFVEKGYCNEIETNTILNYRIIDPQIILDKIEKDYNDKHKSSLTLLKDTFGEIQSLYKPGTQENENKENEIELIRGFNKHRVAKYLELFRNTNKEVLGMFRLKGVVTDELDTTAKKLITNGGVIRSIYQISLDFKILKAGKLIPATPEDLVRVCESFEKYGEQVRLSNIKIPNISIFDKENIFINMSEKSVPKNKQADIIIKNPDFASHMIDLFNFYWEQGITVEEYKKTIEIQKS
jgi:sugar-specific transcriptional regulator TrmB